MKTEGFIYIMGAVGSVAEMALDALSGRLLLVLLNADRTEIFLQVIAYPLAGAAAAVLGRIAYDLWSEWRWWKSFGRPTKETWREFNEWRGRQLTGRLHDPQDGEGLDK